jgi:hypothetical protein
LRDEEALMASEWRRLLNNVMGGDDRRVNSLWSAIGYLLHDYKDSANAKAIIFVDEEISDVPSGRTGKSLAARGLRELVPAQKIETRNFNFGGQFSFQSIGIEDQFIEFDDAPEDFQFENLFGVTTGDMQVERKYQDEVTIPFDDLPKILITTNYVIEGEDASFEDRVFHIEFAPHYGKNHRPEDDFGHRLFEEEWGRKNWRRFDNLSMLLVRKYLRDGLKPYRHKNLEKRKLRQETSTS